MSQFFGGAATGDNWPMVQWDALPWFIRAARRDFSYWRRGDSQFGARNRYATIWPQSGFMSGDRSPGFCQIGQDVCERDDWSPMQKASRGTSSAKFIRGQTKDSGGNALGGATVQCFRTADDMIVSETASDGSGNYEASTVYPDVAHYLVAYYASGNLAGTTVNTLLPKNRDGT
jgi:hypothetical protein